MLSERENIAIAELAVYIPSIVFAMAIIFRHGLSKGRPWIYLVVFCGLRIVSAIFQILSANHPTNRDDATWAAILGSIGLSPLFLVASGLLRRVYVYLCKDFVIQLTLVTVTISSPGTLPVFVFLKCFTYRSCLL